MKNIKLGNSLISTILVLTIAISSISVILPMANAQTRPTVNLPYFIYVAAAPNPVGVGEPLTLVTWTALMAIPTWEDPTLGAPGGRETYLGYTITVTKPDGTTETLTLPPSDPVGSNWYTYTPEQVGTYKIQAHFPAQWKNITRTTWPPWGSTQGLAANTNYYCEAADSEEREFTVVEEGIKPISGVPLPTEYWSRPIHAYNREWSQIAGNWVTGLENSELISAPNSAHVVWTEPYFYGGIAGGFGDTSWYEGTSYEQKFGNPTIIGGILIYNENLGSSMVTSQRAIMARDLRTGELLWRLNATSISGSTIYNYESRNQHGVHPYLWTSGTTSVSSFTAAVPGSVAVDPFTGQELFGFTDVPSGTVGVGPNGERLLYVLGGPSSGRTWLALWNSTAPLSMTGISGSQLAWYQQTGELLGTGYDQWRPIGKIHNGTEAYTWNATLPAGSKISEQSFTMNVVSDKIIGGQGFANFGTSVLTGNFRIWAISTEPGRQGQILWDKMIQPPAANVTLQLHTGMASEDDGILLVRVKELRQWIALDINTGNQLYTTEPEPDWMMYSRNVNFANGKFYTGGYGGEIFAYDAATGERLWTASVDNEGLESAYERSPLSLQVVDGKVFARSQEHSMTHPYYRTWRFYAFDGETGDRLWDLNGGWSAAAFSDGYMTALNFFDGQIYAIAKGPSATTVEASPKTSVHGNNVVIEGYVTDISAGTKKNAIASRFPNGVAAVSEDSMTDWMEYVYMQKPKPSNASGVEVTIEVLDANGNYRPVGTATSDSNGFYSFEWTPDIEGKYTVVANFKGSESYWPSSSQTAIVVNEAAPQATQQPAAAQSMVETYVLGTGIAIIIAIAILGILLLRKRP